MSAPRRPKVDAFDLAQKYKAERNEARAQRDVLLGAIGTMLREWQIGTVNSQAARPVFQTAARILAEIKNGGAR